ncbi:MAG: protease inhibitor I42 family protein [Cellulosilyticaceae bacterium]
MKTIPITNPVSAIPVGQAFTITLKETPCTNCRWQINVPSAIGLLNISSDQDYNYSSTTWTFQTNIAGTYFLEFSYQKQCCGKPVLQHYAFRIDIR